MGAAPVLAITDRVFSSTGSRRSGTNTCPEHGATNRHRRRCPTEELTQLDAARSGTISRRCTRPARLRRFVQYEPRVHSTEPGCVCHRGELEHHDECARELILVIRWQRFVGLEVVQRAAFSSSLARLSGDNSISNVRSLRVNSTVDVHPSRRAG